ncbi:Glycogenin-1 [Dissophora ornata]|nr:Glycogenin-1 [Dissophora ornata]
MEAYITLLTNNSYASGALVLAYSLRVSQTSKQLAILITSEVSRSIRDRLAAVYDAVIEIGEINSHSTKNLQLLGRPELGVTLTKIHVFNQTQYSKVVFLDADTLVLRNVDDLFDKAANGSVDDNDRNRRFAAAPDAGWPDCFNSGVFVCRPSYQDYNGLIEMANQQGTFDGGDQGLLNSYFSGWSTGDSSNRLPFLYNTTPTSVYSYAPAFQQYRDKLAIVHFVGSFKPWQWLRFADGTVFPRNTSSTDSITLVQQWWHVFDQYVGGKPSDIHEVSHGYELPPQSQWDVVGLDGEPKGPETEKKQHYDGWFQPYKQQQPTPPQDEKQQPNPPQDEEQQHESGHEHNESHHHETSVQSDHEHKRQEWYTSNPHHLTDYHYQPESEPEIQPPHHNHHNRCDSAFDYYADYQNAWDIDEDPRMIHPPLYFEKPVEIIEKRESGRGYSPYPSGNGHPVFPWESDHSTFSKSKTDHNRTPSRVYYNYTASAQERQEYFEWEAARRQEYEECLLEQHRQQEYARYERDRLVAEAQARVQSSQALENYKLVNAWDLDLGVQISILQRTERLKPSKPAPKSLSRRNSMQQQQFQELYDAELIRKRRGEEERWQREQEEVRLKEEEERIQRSRLMAKKKGTGRMATAATMVVATGVAAASEYVFRNAWDPPETVLHKKKIAIEDEEVSLALPLRHDREAISIKAQDAAALKTMAVAVDDTAEIDVYGRVAKDRRTDTNSKVVAKTSDSSLSFSPSSFSEKTTTAGSYRFIRTTVTSTITRRQFKNGVEVSSSTSSGSSGGEVMFEVPAGVRSLPYFTRGHQSTYARNRQEPSLLAIQTLSGTISTPESKVQPSIRLEPSSSKIVQNLVVSSPSETQSRGSKDTKRNPALSINTQTYTSITGTTKSQKRIDLRETQASEIAVARASRVLSRYPQATSRYTTRVAIAQDITGAAAAVEETLYAGDPNLSQPPPGSKMVHVAYEDELEELEFFGERRTHAALPVSSPYMPSTPLAPIVSERYRGGGSASGLSSRAGSRPTTPGASTPSRFGPSTPRGTTKLRKADESSSRDRRAVTSTSSPSLYGQQVHQQEPVDAGFSNYRIEWNWKELAGKKPRHWSTKYGEERYDPYNALSTHGSSADSGEETRDVLEESTDDEDSSEDERGGRSSAVSEDSEFSRAAGFVIRGGKIARRRSSVALDRQEL